MLIKTHVGSMALYGCETWTINEKEKDMLKALKMWCWKNKVDWKKNKWGSLKDNRIKTNINSYYAKENEIAYYDKTRLRGRPMQNKIHRPNNERCESHLLQRALGYGKQQEKHG